MEDPVKQPEFDGPKDEETCRICRGESTEEEPLFHPCKCSGSIKHVHQPCLDEWLKHSKKPPVCELCNTPYRFTKVYSHNMPSQLPILVVMRKFASDVADGGIFAARCALVFVIWLFCLPLTASYVCYVYTIIAESIPFDLQRLYHPDATIVSEFGKPRTASIIPLHGFVEDKISSRAIRHIVLDMLQGQVIILFLVLIFFVVMIVREWILQNDLFMDQMRDIGRQRHPQAGAGAGNGNRQLPFEVQVRNGQRRLMFNGQDINNLRVNGGDEAVNVLFRQEAIRQLEQMRQEFQAQQHQQDRQRDDEWEDDDDDDDVADDMDHIDDIPHVHDGFEEEQEEEDEDDDDDQFPDPPQQAAQQPANIQWDLEGEELDRNDADGGILELVGIRGPFLALMGSYSAANIASVLVTGLLYFLPYSCGRLVVALFLNKPASWARYALQVLLYYGNEVFYQGAKAFAKTGVSFVDLSVLEQEAVARRAAGLVFTPLETVLPGTGISYRIACTLVGHGIVLTVASMYASSMKRFSSPRNWTTELAILQYIAQARAILKVITVIGIELVVFPIFCGILLLEIALDPLYADVTIADRIQFTLNHPVTGTFTHWAVGTCYMFLFAMFVSLCRKIMRPGVLYFVRDPNDPNFHPIRDVLDRRLGSQLGKIGISAIIYSVLIVGCIGGVVYGLRYGLNVNYLPLQLTPVVETDKLFTIAPMIASYNLLLPILVKIIRSLNIMKKVWDNVFHYSCSLLRLSSFILNKPVRQEQGYVYFGSWWAKLRFAQPDYSRPVTLDEAKQGDSNAAYFIPNGRFVRAPNTDSITSKVVLKMFIPVTKDDERLDGKTSDGEQELTQYSIVYRPPLFRLRIVLLLLIIWAAGIAVVFTVSALPLLVGRGIMKSLFPEDKLGDLVYYSVGIVPVAVAIYVADNWSTFSEYLTKEVFQMTTLERQRLYEKILNGLRVIFKVVFCAFVLLGFIPIMLGTLVDLYIAIPATVYLYAGNTPFEMSVLGNLLHGVVAMILTKDIILSRFPNSTPAIRYREMTHGGWVNYDINVAIKSFILPLIGITLVGALLPRSLAWIATHTLYNKANEVTIDLVYKFAYPAALVTGLLFMLFAGMVSAWRRWETAVRDDAYMVGRQLQNM